MDIKTALELLEVDLSNTWTEIKCLWRIKVRQLHSDKTGYNSQENNEKLSNINEAKELLNVIFNQPGNKVFLFYLENCDENLRSYILKNIHIEKIGLIAEKTTWDHPNLWQTLDKMGVVIPWSSRDLVNKAWQLTKMPMRFFKECIPFEHNEVVPSSLIIKKNQ